MRKINKLHVKPVSEMASKLRERVRTPVLQFGSVITFGKYKGDTLYNVLNNDIDYVEWLLTEKAIAIDEPTYRFFLVKQIEGQAQKAAHNMQYKPQKNDLPF